MLFGSLMTAQTWNVIDEPAVPIGNCEFMIPMTIEVEGFSATDRVSEMIVSFAISNTFNFTIEEVVWNDQPNPLIDDGAELFMSSSGFSIVHQNTDGGPPLASDIDGIEISVMISTVEPGECFNFTQVGSPSFLIQGDGTNYPNGPATGNNINVCSSGDLLYGSVEVLNDQEDQVPVCNTLYGVDIEITQMTTGDKCLTESGLNGSYGCEFCGEGPYEVCVEESCDEPCGLTAQDLTLIRQLILGARAPRWFDCYYADVNADGTISTYDIALLQSVLNDNPSVNAPTQWCRWLPLSDVPTGNDPTLCTPSNLDRNCFDYGPNFTLLRFYIGDFNASCADCNHNDLKDDDIESRFLVQEEAFNLSSGKAGENTEVYSDSDDKLYSLALLIDSDDFEEEVFVQSELPGLEYSLSDEGLRILWFSEEGKSSKDYISTGDPLFVIENTLVTRFELTGYEENVLLTDEGIFGIEIRSREEERETPTLFEVYGSRIQPIRQADYTVRVYDFNGRQVLELKNSTAVDLSTRLASGFYIVRAEGEGYNQVEKILIP